MNKRSLVESGGEVRRVIQQPMRKDPDQFIVQVNIGSEGNQQERRHIKEHGAPTPVFEQVITNRIDRAEMQEQRREHYEGSVAKKSDRQIEIAISSHRRVEVKYKRRETQPGEVQNERRATALFEDYEQSDT